MGFFLKKKPMTNKIKKFLYTLEHLIPDGYDEIPTFAPATCCQIIVVQGVLLMGDYFSMDTTELLKPDGTTEPSFKLEPGRR